MYLDGLPSDSLTRTAQRNEYSDDELAEFAAEDHEHGPWSHTDLLLAAVWDLIAQTNHDPKKGAAPRYPRPGVSTSGPGGRKGRMTSAQMDLYMQKRKIAD